MNNFNMKAILNLIILIFVTSTLLSQVQDVKKSFPIGINNQSNQVTNGISVGIFHSKELTNSTTNGLRLELLGQGIISLFVDNSPNNDIDSLPPIITSYSEKINGVSFSTLGLFGEQKINGLHIGIFGNKTALINGICLTGVINSGEKINGISIAGYMNQYKIQNGLIAAGLGNFIHSGSGVLLASFTNNTRFFNGIQISLFNHCYSGNLIQIGLLNRIETNPKWCRILPFINIGKK